MAVGLVAGQAVGLGVAQVWPGAPVVNPGLPKSGWGWPGLPRSGQV
ncbi:hypothetical protein [Actinosynnema pretiosum]|nr:hypothetical protein [Actinosynnema pretiosum]